MKKDEKNGSTGRTICTRSLATSTSAAVEQETPNLRRSSRETPSKKPITTASSTRKSERLAPSSPASLTKKSGKTEKKNAASTLPRSNNVSSQNSKGSDKSGSNAENSSNKKKNNLEESTSEIKKRDPTMTARAYRALLFRGQHKKSKALDTDGDSSKDSAENLVASPLCHLAHQKSQMQELNPSSNEEELVVVGCSRRVPAGNDDVRDGNTDCPPHANSESKRLSVDETSLEKDTNFPSKLIRDTEKTVLDASPMVETGGDRVICSPSENPETQKLRVSVTSLESDIDLPLKRKRDSADGDEPFISSNGVIPSPSGCKKNSESETCIKCGKRQKVNGEFEDLRVCSCIAQPVQAFDHVGKDVKETEPAMSRDHGENRQNMQEDKSYDAKSCSSMYPEYWVPVQLSDVQLEQYCRTLLSKSVSLSSLKSKNDLGALEETLTSVRKTCEHPYVADASFKVNQLLTKNLELHEIMDVEIKASGKLYLLDAMLTQIKENGLKAVILYQTILCPEGLLLGNILEDFVRERFGQKSYEHGIFTSKKNAVNNFNKESQCFVLLLEKRACQSIKLLRAEAFIIFGSNLNPSLDIKLLEKIKIESSSERTKIFRLYSTFTVEEKALILARQNKWQNKSVENPGRPLTHAMLMWGASYLFDKLNHFHGGKSPDSGVPCEQDIMDGVIQEFSSILSSRGGENNEGKLCLLLEAKHAQGTYSTDCTLFGEEHVKLADESSPNIFWTKLLEGKNPTWKYCSGTLQRNRKRVQYFPDSEDGATISNGGNSKKRKKVSEDVTTPPADKNERKASGKDHIGALESPIVIGLRSTCRSASGTNGTLNGNDAVGLYSTGVHISGIPEDMLAGRDWTKMPRESQRSLHAVLKLEIAKLGKILHLSEDWTSMVEKFLEYVIENYRVCEKPANILQAFQIALVWIAALLIKQKPKKKESLVLAKSELAFSCSREEVDYIYFLLYCMKSLFLERTQDTKPMRSSGGEECMSEKRGSHHSSATKDIKKTTSDIKKKCKKQELKLVQKHEEEKVELVKKNEDKRKDLETKKKVEAALIRFTCSHASSQTKMDGLKQLDQNYERQFDEIANEMEECLKRLEQMHEAAKKKLAEDEACWISRIENWAQAELINCGSIKSGNNNHLGGIWSSNTPKNAPDVQTCNDANSEAARTDTNCMVSERIQVPEAGNTLGTMSGSSTQKVHEMVTSRNDKAMDVSTLPSEQPTDNVATKSQSNEHASVTVPEILIPTGCQEELGAVNVHLEKACSLGKEIPEELVLNMPQPASVIETRGPAESNQDDQDICPIPSSPVEKQLDTAADIQGQNIESVNETQPAGSETVETGGFAASEQVPANETQPTGSETVSEQVPANETQPTGSETVSEQVPANETQPAGLETVSEQGDEVTCPLPSSPAGNQPEPANVGGQNIKASAESHIAGPDAVENGESAVSDQETMVAQDACSLPSLLVGTQSDLAANLEDQIIKTSAEPHISGSEAVEIGHSVVSDKETMAAPDAYSLPSSLVGVQSDLAANTEGQNISTVAQLHTAGSDAVKTVVSPVADQVAQNTSPLPLSSAGNHPDAAVNVEGLNDTTVAEPHTTEPEACEMEIAESVPQVDHPTVAANNQVQLVHEGGGGVEPSAAVVVTPPIPSLVNSGVESSAAVVTPPVPLLVNHGMGQGAPPPFPQIPFPVFSDPFQYEMERLRRETENTRKTYEEKRSTLKAELERKMAELQAEYQRKFHDVEAEHNARVTEIEMNRSLVSMNKLLASAFMSKCTDKSASHPTAATRGRIQQLAQVAAQMNALRDRTIPAPPLAPAQALPLAPAPTPALAPVQPQASSYPRPMPQQRQSLIISSSAPSPSPSPSVTPTTNAAVRRVPPPHLRLSSSIPIGTSTIPASSPLPPQASTYSAQLQNLSNGLLIKQQQEHRQQQNLSDVVCLSDDDE